MTELEGGGATFEGGQRGFSDDVRFEQRMGQSRNVRLADTRGEFQGKGNHMSKGSEPKFMLSSRSGGYVKGGADYSSLLDHGKNFGFF